MIVNNIFEDEWIKEYLEKRNLLKQFKKAKNKILSWINSNNYFKERKPKNSNIWYFRINKKYRAYWSIDKDWDLIIFEINDHQ